MGISPKGIQIIKETGILPENMQNDIHEIKDPPCIVFRGIHINRSILAREFVTNSRNKGLDLGMGGPGTKDQVVGIGTDSANIQYSDVDTLFILKCADDGGYDRILGVVQTVS